MTEATENLLLDDEKPDLETVEVVLEDGDKAETGKEPVVEVAKADEPPRKAEVTPDEGIADLKRQLEEEKQRAEREHMARVEAERRATVAQSEAKDANLEFVKTTIDAVKRETEVLKNNLKIAMQTGDFDKVPDIQEAISINAARLMRLEDGKTAMEAQAKQPVRPMTYADPVEQLVSQLSPRSADWVRKHPDYARDKRKLDQMVAAHNLAVASDYQPDTDGYFSFVEKTLGIVSHETPRAAEQDPMESAAKPVTTQRRAAPPAAPPARAGSDGGGSPHVVRLTAEQREMAQMMGMTDKEYAQNLVALRKIGKIQS